MMDAHMEEDPILNAFSDAASEQTAEDAPGSRADIALEVVRLAGLADAEYQMARKAAAREVGLGVTALDKLVKAERGRRRADDAAKARRKAPPRAGEVRWPFGFDMEKDGLCADQGEAGQVWLCAPLEVLGEARDATGEGWSLWLRWQDRDGRPHTWPMPARLLVTAPGELEAALLERGLRVSPNPAARLLLREALGGVQAGSRVTLVSRSGWHAVGSDEAAYILPDGAVIGATAETLVMKAPPENAVQMVAQAGTLQGWQEEVAAPAAGNPMAAFLLSAAFAGPLLDACGEPSGGFHVTGRSKVGKTLALRLSLSAWGPPVKGAMLRDWRSTANGLEGAAEEAGDGLLGLDELHQADPREVASACYMLANESGKGRMRRDTTAQRRRTWRTFILSTGELDIATVVSRTGQSLPAGAEVRLPSISVDGESAWPTWHGRATLGELMTDLHAGLRRHHGHAARAFIAKLAEARRADAAGLAAAAAAMCDRMTATLPAAADPQVRDVARRCALVALAGELATLWGILPWTEDEAFGAAKTMLARWVEKRGGGGATEEAQHVRAVRLFLTEHGASRFVAIHFERGLNSGGWVESHPDRPVIKRAGWRRRVGNGDEYLISPEVWRELCQEAGIDPTEAARTLRAEGFLTSGEDKNLARRETVPGVGRPRVYVIKSDLMGDPEAPKGGG